MNTDESPSGVAPIPRDSILVPRRIVYFQAALLGIIATTFFIFGMMVGTLTSRSDDRQNPGNELKVAGQVKILDAGKSEPDAGAVVFFLPAEPTEISRQDPLIVRPDNFEPLENPTIDWIRGQGGTVVRVNINGEFEIFARPGNYNLLVISKAAKSDRAQKLSKEQVASISQYFLPVEKLIDRQDFYWQTIQLDEESVSLDVINFE